MSDKVEVKPKQCHYCKYFEYRTGWAHNGVCCAERKTENRNGADIACRHGVLKE